MLQSMHLLWKYFSFLKFDMEILLKSQVSKLWVPETEAWISLLMELP